MKILLVLLFSVMLVPSAFAGSATCEIDVTPLLYSSDMAVPVDPSPQPLSIEIDQDQPSGPTYMAGFSQGDLAQSFQQTHDNIAGAGILLQTGIGSSAIVNIALWDGLPNAGGVMITDASDTGTAGNWVDVYWTAEMITPGDTYYLVFTGNTSLGISGDTSNPYPYGNVYANSGFTPFAGFDYAFRTYYDTDVALERNTWAGIKAVF
jgi:hypothetical protein